MTLNITPYPYNNLEKRKGELEMREYKALAIFSLLLIVLIGLQLLASPTTASTIDADVDIVPDVFNLRQVGVITAYVSNLRKDDVSYSVNDINASTVGLYYEDSLVAEALQAKIENDVLIVKFDSYTVANYIWTYIAYHMGTIPPQTNFAITLTVRGQLISNGEEFAGSDTIKIILP